MTTIVLFYYTLFILLVSITAAAFCLSGYLISHRRLFAYACVGFIAYFLDVALVFQDDFLLRGVTSVAPDSVYFVGSQLPSIVTGLGILMAFWLCICDFFEVKSKPLIVVPGIAFVVGSLVVFFLTDSGPVGLFVFYGMRSLFMVWVLAFVGVCYMQSPDGAVRERLWRYRWFYVGAWVLVFAIVAENGVLMFVIDPALVSTGSVPFFPERNFAENILMMWFAGFVCVDCWKLFSLHFKNATCGQRRQIGRVHRQRPGILSRSLRSFRARGRGASGGFAGQGQPAYRQRYEPGAFHGQGARAQHPA